MRERADSGAAVAVSDLSATYPAHGASVACLAVRGVSFRVARGEIVGLAGESGSGKSTLAELFSGGARASARSEGAARIVGGDARVVGYSLRHLRARQYSRLSFATGYLHQDGASQLVPTLTVAENITAPIFARDKRYSQKAAGARAATMVEAVKLSLGVLSAFPFELSGGQRQRVALARALVLGPKLLIADAPTAGIDVTVRDAVLDAIVQLRRQPGFAAVIVSNDLHVLRTLTDRVAVLHQGTLVGLGPIDEVLASPQHPYVKTLAIALRTGANTIEVEE